MINAIFAVIVIVFAFYFFYSFFTKSGQLNSVKVSTGSKEIVELGDLTPTQFKSQIAQVNQSLKLYRCSNDQEKYFVLEPTFKGFGYIQRYWVKLTPEILTELKNLTKED